MSCTITYKGKKYSEEQFKEHFINNKQEFTTSIAKNKDVIDSFKRKMEGIDFVFSQSPELASIGSKAQYLQYLSTIFKTSKVKDIVYHGTGAVFENFNENKELLQEGLVGKGIYFTANKKFADGYAKEGYKFLLDYKNKNLKTFLEEADLLGVTDIQERTIPVILNMINPIVLKNNDEEIKKYKDSNNIIFEGYGEGKEFKVLFNKQIHTLGSKQDVEGFKEFIQGKPNDVKSGVEELFNKNETLANAVYEALGFSKKLDFYKGDTLTIDEKIYSIVEKISSKELAKRNGLTISSNIPVYIVSEFLGSRKGGYDTVNNIIILSKDSDKETIHHELIHSVEYNLDKSELNHLYEKVKDSITEDSFNGFVSWNFKKNISEFVADALSKKVFRNALKKEGLLEEVDNVLSVYTSDTTPQQKQQAQIKFQEYINATGRQDIEGFKEFVQGKQYQKLTAEEKAKTIEQVTKEHRSIVALKDLAHKLAWRIGGKVKFENKTDADWKGYNQGNTSVLNEAYMTPDTPFHEILAHPIIRAIKESDFYKKVNNSYDFVEWVENNKPEYKPAPFMEGIMPEKRFKEAYGKYGKEFEKLYPNKSYTFNSLYQSFIKELETGRGKEVFEQVKRDYVSKQTKYPILERVGKVPYGGIYEKDGIIYSVNGKDFFNKDEAIKFQNNNLDFSQKYTLEEQQEEAIVTLLGMMAADKLDAKKDATLISKLKELWKQISDFVKSLLRQDGIKIDELPITTTLNDLAEIMAYGNNKIILPGYKVEYSTPLGNKYDTLEEVNNEIRGLADANVEVDLSGVKIEKHTGVIIPAFIKTFERNENGVKVIYSRLNEQWKKHIEGEYEQTKITIDEANKAYSTETSLDNYVQQFIEKNKEYEQSKEIIEEWKKENSIVYDPEEVYSRGQGFYSSIGAYSNLELDLLLKNLIQHIQDNKKAGGEFTISAFTKPIDKRLKHIEGTGDRVRFVIYPKSNHIKWAAPTDVYSGSVWDAHEKVSKDKKSELLGVSFTKAPALSNINEVSPNLADIIDNLSHVHNELGIELTTDNFRIEYDDNIDYAIKKLIDNINKILDDKYGKLEKPEINSANKKELKYSLEVDAQKQGIFDTKEEAERIGKLAEETGVDYLIKEVYVQQGKQPTQTKENTTSIESVKDKFKKEVTNYYINSDDEQWLSTAYKSKIEAENYIKEQKIKGYLKDAYIIEKKEKEFEEKKYYQQAIINLKIAALKEVARKYPRSLITSKVVPINYNMVDNSEIQYSKIGSKQDIEGFKKFILNINSQEENIELNLPSKINQFYTDLTQEEKNKIGDIEKLYNEQTFPMEETEFIDMLKCKI